MIYDLDRPIFLITTILFNHWLILSHYNLGIRRYWENYGFVFHLILNFCDCFRCLDPSPMMKYGLIRGIQLWVWSRGFTCIKERPTQTPNSKKYKKACWLPINSIVDNKEFHVETSVIWKFVRLEESKFVQYRYREGDIGWTNRRRYSL